jgi:hypothetical protein
MSRSNHHSSPKATPGIKNWVSVESPYGLRNFTLHFGDITRATDAALAVPTHAYEDHPLTGAVLSALTQMFGVDFESHEPLLVPEPCFGTFRVTKCGGLEDRLVLLVRIPGIYSVGERGEEPLVAYRRALWTLFGSLAALEMRGEQHGSLAMPLLAATRGYAIPEIMRVILEVSLDWLRTSRYMKAVNLYLIEADLVQTWTDAMDEVLGRKFIDSAQNQMGEALRDEIMVRLGAPSRRFSAVAWTTCAENLRSTLGHRKIALERVAVESRALVECIVRTLLKEDGVQQPKGTLEEQINELRRRRKIAPWILSHFDCLRILGNAGVHLAGDVSYHPPRLREDDLIGILAALQRTLAFAHDDGRPPSA